MAGSKITQFLGWFSIGLGIAELVAPGALGRMLGMQNRKGLLRVYGLRELGAGLGILAQARRPAAWLWGRVAGDALDIVTLRKADHWRNRRRGNVRGALAAVAGVTAIDIVEAIRQSRLQHAPNTVHTAPPLRT
jgi:hypothetical protein